MLHEKRKVRRILAIDGGGVRGVIPATLLAAIESRSGTPIAEQFDLIAGTSTGGLIALALGIGISAMDVVALYKELGAHVFGHARFTSALSPKYRLEQLEQVLRPKFDGKRLGNSTTRLIVPAYDVANQSLYVYKTAHHTRLKVDYKESLLRVACCTAAAPSYFEAYSKDGAALVDGGVWANNPTGIATVEAYSLLGWGNDDIRVLSIGCGETPFDFPRTGGWFSVAIRFTGFFRLKASPIIQLMMKGQSDAALGTARLLTGHSKDNPKVYRYEPDAQRIGNTGLDDYKSLPMLEKLGNELAVMVIDELSATFIVGRCDPFRPVYELNGLSEQPERSQRVPV